MNHHASDPEDDIRRVLESAGARPQIDDEDLAQIRAAARSAWEEMVEAERPRRSSFRLSLGLALAASVLLAVAVGWLWMQNRSPAAPEAIASIVLVRGEVTLGASGEAGPPSTSAQLLHRTLAAGALLETPSGIGDGAATVALAMASGQSIRLAGGSRLKLISSTQLALERGALYFDSAAAPATREPIEILTPIGVVRDLGTQYEVRLGPDGAEGLRLRVREGTVSLDQAGTAHSADRGQEIVLRPDGRISRRPFATHGEAWNWILAATPAIDIEGRSLASFLAWVGRETGREVIWEDAGLAAEAATEIILHGSIVEGLRPDQAFAEVIAGTDLACEIEGGGIVVTRSGASSELQPQSG